MENKFLVSGTPHIRSTETIDSIMKNVIIALIPATIAGIYFFGIYSALVVLVSIASCIFFEYLFCVITKQTPQIRDCSAVVTGLLLAMNLPPSIPLWIPIIGSAFAIMIVKMLFGGLGQNFMNPALAARAFLLVSFGLPMTTWTLPRHAAEGLDMATYATPLAQNLKVITGNDYVNAIIGNIGGSLGETSAILLLLGGLYLIYKKIISWRIPAIYLLTMFLLSFLFNKNGLYEILIGGVMLGAFFMATDYSSSPVTPTGQLIMGFGCGFLTVILREFTTYPEVVSFSILIMNLIVPLIDKFTAPKVFGVEKGGKA